MSGHDPKVWEHALIHIRASGPVSFGGLKSWLLRQTPGVDASNADQVTREFIAGAKERRVITVDDAGDIDMR